MRKEIVSEKMSFWEFRIFQPDGPTFFQTVLHLFLHGISGTRIMRICNFPLFRRTDPLDRKLLLQKVQTHTERQPLQEEKRAMASHGLKIMPGIHGISNLQRSTITALLGYNNRLQPYRGSFLMQLIYRSHGP